MRAAAIKFRFFISFGKARDLRIFPKTLTFRQI
jgi:hypothetical protein